MGRLLLRFGLVLVVTLLVVIVGQRFLAPGDEAEAVQVATVPIRVASVDLAVGTFLDEVEAPFREWPEVEIEEGWITEDVAEDEDVIGAVVIRPVAAGRPLDRTALLLPGQDGFLAAVLQPGMRAVSVGVDAVSGNAGHVFPGDRVDVILTQKLETTSIRAGDWASETILQAVRVIAVDQNLLEDLTAREATRVPRTFTLEVRPEDAERISVASRLGQLSFTLRSLLTEDRPVEVMSATGGTFATDVSRVRHDAALAQTPEPTAAEEPAAPPREVRVMRGRASSVASEGLQ